MTLAEFIVLIEEFNLPVENPVRYLFMIRETTYADMRCAIERDEWSWLDEDGPGGDSTDGHGNRWVRPLGRIADD